MEELLSSVLAIDLRGVLRGHHPVGDVHLTHFTLDVGRERERERGGGGGGKVSLMD